MIHSIISGAFFYHCLRCVWRATSRFRCQHHRCRIRTSTGQLTQEEPQPLHRLLRPCIHPGEHPIHPQGLPDDFILLNHRPTSSTIASAFEFAPDQHRRSHILQGAYFYLWEAPRPPSDSSVHHPSRAGHATSFIHAHNPLFALSTSILHHSQLLWSTEALQTSWSQLHMSYTTTGKFSHYFSYISYAIDAIAFGRVSHGFKRSPPALRTTFIPIRTPLLFTPHIPFVPHIISIPCHCQLVDLTANITVQFFSFNFRFFTHLRMQSSHLITFSPQIQFWLCSTPTHDCILRQVHQLEGALFHSLSSISIIAAPPPTSLILNRFQLSLGKWRRSLIAEYATLEGVCCDNWIHYFLSTFILRLRLPVSSFSFSHI